MTNHEPNHTDTSRSGDLVKECRLDAKAFRENTVYDSDGDPIRLIANAERLDQYADCIEALEAENERLRDDSWFDQFEEQEQLRDNAEQRLSVVEAENERLRLDVETQEALQVSAYHAGLRAGWNFGVSDDNAGMQAALSDTDHIKELRRIREARAALGEKQ